MVDVLFLEDQEGELTSFKAIKKVHKVNDYKKKEQLINVYRNAVWISPEVIKTVNRVVNNF